MKLLGTIRASDVFPGAVDRPDEAYGDVRITVRLALEDSEGKFGFVLYPKREGFAHDYYATLGGGVHEGETLLDALRREAREEVGCEIQGIEEVGLIKEFGIDNTNQAGESYCYRAKVYGEKGIPHYDEKESAGGACPVWLTRQEIQSVVENQIPGFSKHRTRLLFDSIE